MSSPAVLIIDDVVDAAARQLQRDLRRKKVRAKALQPEDVEKSDINEAHLILIDYELTKWSQLQNLPIARSPKDGLAVASVLRRYAARDGGISPKAFAMYTGKLGDLAKPLPRENRLHTLARLNNLEWVFRKNDDILVQVNALANAISTLPQPTAGKTFPLINWLKIPRGPLRDKLFREVHDCHPPVHEITQWSHGLAVVRWLLHHILPYPTFLWDSRRVAIRLRIAHREFEKEISRDSRLNKLLKQCRYEGALSDFDGNRWWRAGVEHLIWDLTDGQSGSDDAVRRAIKRATRRSAKLVKSKWPVYCVNKNFGPLNQDISADTAVRIQPDDWPAYAEQAWTSAKLASNEPKLKAIVLPEDKSKLAAAK